LRPNDDLIPLSEAINQPDRPAMASPSQPMLGRDVYHAQYQELLSLDTNARAYGWEIGRHWGYHEGQNLPEVIESSVDNPFIGPDWRERLT
jgi:hypothetical protein